VDFTPLREENAYPAMPEDGCGWEKLYSEQMCRHFREGFGLETRVAQFHNVYGSFGTYDGGREKAPAAVCRKVIAAQMTGSGDDIDDCIKGKLDIAESDIVEAINLGSSQPVSIKQLVDVVEEIAG
jgi:GDP-D-mannose 3',5'-epimerase